MADSPTVDDLFGDPATSAVGTDSIGGGDVLIDMDGTGAGSSGASSNPMTTDDLAFQTFSPSVSASQGGAATGEASAPPATSSSTLLPTTASGAGASSSSGSGSASGSGFANPFSSLLFGSGGDAGAPGSQGVPSQNAAAPSQLQGGQMQQMERQDPQPTAAANAANAAVWSLDYYKPWFDVDTRQIALRLWRALLPTKPLLAEDTGRAVDLYGPFWTTTTLIFTIAVSTNIANFVEFTPTEKEAVWHYDFNKVLLACTVIYSYVTFVPAGLWVFFKFTGAQIALMDLVCVYGYSMLVFNITAVMSMIPHTSVRWLLAAVGWGVSSAVLAVNTLTFLTNMPIKAKPGALAAVGLNLALAVALKFLFFSY